ncbi:LysM peptidoglycan-binding domain-containing protein [Rossellomorea vietnamensis]|uniref:LysM peptidoglycan-binding domain-containing protein n=1 Tax=Rossellomorea vietnamensis TaxID=218284 RepID=A0A5D4NRH5_9BACI|nr:LysM peptidoglycan-binding domain-containing protein [Rossellomorea vietnamensis]TYS15906.1 LysM peptidoglycan-binding domain-containing protein [Rossellomorea vietnamensis]
MNIHVVQGGDTLWSLSQKYRVPINQISAGNQLKNPDQLVIGQSLFVPQPEQEYIVQPGDTLWSISQRLRVPFTTLVRFNQLSDPSRLFVGQLLLLPYLEYTVKAGDTLYAIANRYGFTVTELASLNNLANPSAINEGQIIRLPRKQPEIEVNAYSTRTGSEGVGEALNLGPYFTYLTPFTHSITSDGGITELNDADLISAAKSNNVVSLLTLTNFANRTFDSDLAAEVLRSEEKQETLISTILARIREKGYGGLNIDFEYVYPEDRENYNTFLRRIVARLRPEGYSVSTALAPKIKEDQVGLLYEAHDYEAHGEIVDFVVLMTYEWGWAGGRPWAIAPISEVKKVLDYAVTVIPRSKILMGVPLYGKVWKIPWVDGTLARTISPQAAVELAASENVSIQYDETYQSPFFTYTDDSGQENEVWFEDARSIAAKFQTVKDYNLRGVSYWVLGSAFPQNWLVQHATFSVKKYGR